MEDVLQFSAAASFLSKDERDTLSVEMNNGERLLWTGKPDPYRMTKSALPVVLFGIPWTAFALFWTWGASGFGKAFAEPGPITAFPLFGVPFILVGLGMLSAPYWAHRQAVNTFYAITSERILIITLGKRKTVKSYRPDDRNHLERTEATDVSGDLYFSRQEGRDSDGDRTIEKIGFIGVRNVRRVERLIIETFFEPSTLR